MPISDRTAHWRHQHPAMLLFGLGAILRSNLMPLIFGGYLAFQGTQFLIAFLIVLGILLPSVALVMRFIFYAYSLEEDQILIREGVFSKKLRRIPVRRIHNVNTSQGLVARAFGVVKLEIETAGGGAAEATMHALSTSAALELREFIASKKKEFNPSGQTLHEDPPIQKLFHMNPRTIFLAGVTTNRLGMIFVGVAFLLQFYEDRLSQTLDAVLQWLQQSFSFLGEQNPLTIGFGVVLLVIAGITLGLTLGIATAFLSLYNFRLSRKEEDLCVTTGLLTLREYILPQDKIQAVKGQISMLRRPLGFLELRTRSAGRIGTPQEGRSHSDLLIPLTLRERCGHFVQQVWPNALWDEARWKTVDPFTRLQHFRILGCFILLLSLASFKLPFARDHLMASIVFINIIGLCFAWAVAHLTYKQTAYAWDYEFVYIRSGFIGLSFWIIPIRKIQNVRLRQTPFQRRRKLVTLDIDIAGAKAGEKASIRNIPTATAWRLFNLLVHPAAAMKNVVPACQSASVLKKAETPVRESAPTTIPEFS